MVFLTGCKKDQHNISESQKILFMYDYNNVVTGQHNGFLIDNQGDVLTYNNPENWNYHDKHYVLTDKEVTENIKKCELSGNKIPKEELHKYSNYIRNIASSKVSARRIVEDGTGITEFICFQYFENTGTYKGNLIKLEGSSTSENLNFYSKRVTAWMRDIGNNINSK
jgi:hypothetical protein